MGVHDGSGGGRDQAMSIAAKAGQANACLLLAAILIMAPLLRAIG